METTWLYAWVLVITTVFAMPRPGFVAMVVLFALGVWSGRLSHFVRLRHPLNHLSLLPAAIAALPIWLYSALPPSGGWEEWGWSTLLSAQNARTDVALAGFGLLALYLWGRGVWVGLHPPSTETLGKWLVGGAAAFLALFALVAFDRDNVVAPIAGRLELLVLGYFVLGLSTIAIVQARTVHGRAAAAQPISLSWALALVIPMAAIAALGLLFSGDLAPALRAIVEPAVSAAMRGAGATGLAVDRVLIWISDQLLMLFSWLAPVNGPAAKGRLPEPPIGSPVPLPLLRDIIVVAVCALVFIMVARRLGRLGVRLLQRLYRLFRRSARTRAAATEEERTSMWSWQLFRDQVRAAWAGLFGRLRRRQEALVGWARTAMPGGAREPDATDIHAIYRGLLRWAAARGHRRHPATTPHELRCQLAAAAPAVSAGLALITTNYERARYGDMELTDAALAACQTASAEIASADNPVRR